MYVISLNLLIFFLFINFLLFIEIEKVLACICLCNKINVTNKQLCFQDNLKAVQS